MNFSRIFAMPNKKTFSIAPILDFVERWTENSSIIIDPFAGNSLIAFPYTNDLNPNTKAKDHMLATDWIDILIKDKVIADVIILDPPYSPRQVSECYKISGKKVTMIDTQNARLMKNVKHKLLQLCKDNTVLLSFGWNSIGFGTAYSIEEILLVYHGGVHNDTICVAQKFHK